MTLVDTSVWIDFFRDNPTTQVACLRQLILEGKDICTCGIVLSEVLQGIRDDRTYQKTKDYFETLSYLPENKMIFLKAADIYRGLRKKGFTIRKPVDCMIASVALFYDIQLLHSDRDFNPIETHMGLKAIKG